MSVATAKIIPFQPDQIMIDAAFTTRCSEVHVRGSAANGGEVNAEVEIRLEDNLSRRVTEPVLIHWEMFWVGQVDGEWEREARHPFPHADMTFALDEIEPFATALYQAVQLAKKQGYLGSSREA